MRESKTTFPLREAISELQTTDAREWYEKRVGLSWSPDYRGNVVYSTNPTIYRNSYEATFYNLEKGLITSFLAERARLRIPTSVLDLAGGDGTAIRDLLRSGSVHFGVTSSLTDMRTTLQSSEDQQAPHVYVTGDLLRRRTWNEIGKTIKSAGADHFDLIISRPEGGMQVVNSPEVYAVLLDRALNILSPSGGMLVSQMPYMNLHQLRHLKARIDSDPNLTHKFISGFASSIKITKGTSQNTR